MGSDTRPRTVLAWVLGKRNALSASSSQTTSPLTAHSDCSDSEVKLQDTDLLNINRVIVEVEAVEVVTVVINAKTTVTTVTSIRKDIGRTKVIQGETDVAGEVVEEVGDKATPRTHETKRMILDQKVMYKLVST